MLVYQFHANMDIVAQGGKQNQYEDFGSPLNWMDGQGGFKGAK